MNHLADPDSCRALMAKLSERERQVLAQTILDGADKLAARSLGLSYRTIGVHLREVRLKFGVHSTVQAAAIMGRVWEVK